MGQVSRIIGLETEWGIIDTQNSSANALDLSADFVTAYSASGQAAVKSHPIRWDYQGEDPLNDARGYRLARRDADPSQLTDNPLSPAPAIGETVSENKAENAQKNEKTLHSESAKILSSGLMQVKKSNISANGGSFSKVTNNVLLNGARLYVDHAHPEYSAPEVVNPKEAVLWDRAGDLIAREAMEILANNGKEYALYKNNVDGKGAAYGTHENYLMARSVEFTDIIRYLTPFLVTRPILCGAGRVGLGQRSEYPGFQISQRADYVENTVGLETTFNRPIINTRDEPHANSQKYRRLHVIGGDANQFDYSNLLKIGTTSLVLWMLEQDYLPLELESLLLYDAVKASWEVSHDVSLRKGIDMQDGSVLNAIEIQQIYLDLIREQIERFGFPDFDTNEILQLWQETLDALRTNFFAAARKVEWVAKYLTLQAMRERNSLSWDAVKLKAFDLQWHDLRPEKSLVQKLISSGQVDIIYQPSEVLWAVKNPPESTRAYLRGELIKKFSKNIRGASWTSILFDLPDTQNLMRLELLEPLDGNKMKIGKMLAESASVSDFLSRYTGNNF